jgi:hypothetical protein
MEIEVMKMTTGRVPMRSRPAASLQQRSMAESVVETTMTYVTSSAERYT